jgi:hypothetical protein
MTPKQKAEYLVDKYYNVDLLEFGLRIQAKQCALIAVDEILFSGVDYEDYYFDKFLGYKISFKEYYQEVKQEIEKL